MILATKLSILLQYIRTFTPTHRGILYRIAQLLIWLNILFYLASTIFEIPESISTSTDISSLNFDDNPNALTAFWNSQFLITGSANVVSDTTLLLLPMVSILRLQTTARWKLGTALVFLTGLLVVIYIFSQPTTLRLLTSLVPAFRVSVASFIVFT